MNSIDVLLPQLLDQSGVGFDPEKQAQLLRHCELVRDWNDIAGLVSRSEVDVLEPNHLVDSVSLTPVIYRLTHGEGELMDIGSGGGYPALPLKILLPNLRVIMVERSDKKVGFLRKAIGSLGLEGIDVIHGEFPAVVADRSPDLITARAVEKPEQLTKKILGFLSEGAAFICQSGVTLKLPRTFHVEHVEDEWSKNGLRRGTLDVITRLDDD